MYAKTEFQLTDKPNYDLVKRCVEAVLEENFVTSPPVNIFTIVRNSGLDVIYGDFNDFEAVAGYIDLESRRIVVNAGDGPSRQKFTIAHELGHWLMHQELLKRNPDQGVLLRVPLGRPDPDPREKEANSFAAQLLVPDRLLRRDATRFSDLAGGERLLASVFGVSPDVITFRLQNLGVEKS